MLKVYALLGFTVMSAALYHAGGQGQKMFRRAGVPILCYFPALIVLFGWSGWLWYFLSAGLLAFALTTYHDYLAPDGVSENWLCWTMTGLCYGLAALPLLWCGIAWYAIIGRAVALAGITTLISERSGKVFIEETGRGAVIIATLPILLI